MDKTEIREMIEWMEDAGHTEQEIMDCIRKMVGAKRKKKQKEEKNKKK